MYIFQKQSKNILLEILFFLILIFASGFVFRYSKAQEVKVDYGDKVIIDSDLDGLTDEGEKQLFGTNPVLPDTDGDGLLDGAEILEGTNPLVSQASSSIMSSFDDSTSWVWYFSRASGLLAYVFLWFSIFLGLSIRNVFLRKFIEPIYSFDIHCFVSATALFWAFLHGLSLFFHQNEFALSLKEIFIPLQAKENFINNKALALGILGLYTIIVLVATSYGKRFISQRIWRWVHFLNVILLPLIAFHVILLGTDIKIGLVKNIFLVSIVFLVPLYISNLFNHLQRFRNKSKNQ